jgi:hypothetical protein
MPAADVHHATLVILAASTAHVMSVEEMRVRISRRDEGCGGHANT